jgi:hypothetical protein
MNVFLMGVLEVVWHGLKDSFLMTWAGGDHLEVDLLVRPGRAIATLRTSQELPRRWR